MRTRRKEPPINFSRGIHPEAKSLLLNGIEVPYVIKVNKRARRIILRMRSDKIVRITTPPGISSSYIATVLKESAQSILAQYKKLDEREDVYLFQGKPLVVRTLPSKNTHCSVHLGTGEILFTTVTASNEEKRQLYKKMLLKAGKTHLPKRCLELAEKYGFTVTAIRVRHMQSRWGSCTSKKSVTLNAALMQCPQDVTDYVILHELCHTRYPNHSPQFWMEVEKYLPDYRRLRYALRKYPVL